MNKLLCKLFAVLFSILLIDNQSFAQEKGRKNYTPDPDHVTLQFRASHLGLTEITGRFERYTLELSMENEDFATAKLKLRIETASLNSQNALRDAHLKGPDFFDVKNYPYLYFESTQIEALPQAQRYQVTGYLQVKDVRKEVSVQIQTGKPVTDLLDKRRVGFSGFTSLQRKDFGMDFNVVTQDGTPLVSEEVKIDLGMEFIESKK